MFKKSFIKEEEEVELNDFQKILLLNKRKLDPDYVEFTSSQYDLDFNNLVDIEVQSDGILFTFDGLASYLRFFFPDTYGDDGSDGWYEAGYFESMLNSRWDWDFYDRAYEDWKEGYIVDSLKPVHMNIIYDICREYGPSLLKYFTIDENGNMVLNGNSDVNIKVTQFLERLDSKISDELIERHSIASDYAVDSEVPEYIRKTYCNTLSSVGIENETNSYCFYKYKLHWSDAIMLYPRFGVEEDKVLDLLFIAISKGSFNHLPEYYEVQHNAFNYEVFEEYWIPGATIELNNLIERLDSDTDKKTKEYIEVLDKINNSNLSFDKFYPIPNSNVKIKLIDIDKLSLKVKYVLSVFNENPSYGISPIDDIISMYTNASLFNPLDYRKN